MDLGPSLADDDRNHSTPVVLMLGVDRPQMAGKCLSLERKDFTPTSLGDGSAQVISSYLPAHACEVLVLVLLVLVLVLVLSGNAARVRYMIRQHRMLKVQVRGGTRPLPSIASSGRLKSGPPLRSTYTHRPRISTATVRMGCYCRVLGCWGARIRTVLTISDRRLSEAAHIMHRVRCMRR